MVLHVRVVVVEAEVARVVVDEASQAVRSLGTSLKEVVVSKLTGESRNAGTAAVASDPIAEVVVRGVNWRGCKAPLSVSLGDAVRR